jgi:transcriptional regulator with XRE-family HTH domain
MKTFSEWLNYHRKKNKFTFAGLAEAIGGICSNAFLNQVEKNRYKNSKGKPMRPAEEIVLALALVFNADANEALTLAGYAPLNAQTVPAEISNLNWAFVSEREVNLIAVFIKGIVDIKIELKEELDRLKKESPTQEVRVHYEGLEFEDDEEVTQKTFPKSSSSQNQKFLARTR